MSVFARIASNRFRKTGARSCRPRGFTLAEMVVVVVIVGILAAVALPRFTDRSTFDAQGFYDQAQSAVRFAQDAAIAKRMSKVPDRNVVYVVVDTNAGFTRIRGCYDNACANLVPLPPNVTYRKLSDGTQTQFLYVEAPGTVTLTTGLVAQGTGIVTAASQFIFDGEGRPNFTNAQFRFTINGGTPRNFYVEPETGYVHP